MISLNGMPIIIHTLLPFEESEYIDDIILVVKKEEFDQYPPLLQNFSIKKVKKIVVGGESRQESVWKGFSAIPNTCDYIAIHDGARPLITTEQIKKVVLAGYDYRAVSAAAPSKETAKLVNSSRYVEQTVDRDKLWMVQTPQVFYADLYRAAAYTAQKDGFQATDDCSLAEHAGFTVRLVDTGYTNIKITTPEDLLFAKAILDQRKSEKNLSKEECV
jgi:2-C-methyl-D-erythritol 4-phosphate cytidylyltransferase